MYQNVPARFTFLMHFEDAFIKSKFKLFILSVCVFAGYWPVLEILVK